jgi:hypothetical protein
MKKINNILKIMVVLLGVISFTSCETTELDLTQNPNALSPEQASPDFFLNGIQVSFAGFVESFGYVGGQLTRMDQMSGLQYVNAYGPGSFSGRWSSAYSTLMKDISLMNNLAIEKGMKNHVAMAEVMQAYVLFTLVDFFGNVPYSEAIDSENLNPAADDGASVYAAAMALLDSAIAGFDNDAPKPQYDFFYNKNWDQWKKAANTLKMKAYMATRLVDGSAVSNFNAIVSSGNYISSAADDFQFTWGNNEVQPDTRHPRYRSSYTGSGANTYRSNSMMDYMTGTTDAAYSSPWNFDIRTLYYFYRQVSATPGVGGAPADEEVLECGLITPPAHYAGYTWCGVPKGWWGRDHGNEAGIPPDGLSRALTGIYPAGGVLDDLSYDSQINGAGQGGKGITPIMLASWTKFMIAETQMASGDAASARTTMFEGINMSIDKVINFAPSTPRFDWIFGTNSGGPAIAHQDSYIGWFLGDLAIDWDGGDMTDKWDILANQYFVALYGNGIDAYNFYRRTGYPTTLQPNLEPNPGNFPKSMWYPASYANNNSNATQKSNLDVQVFWDNNPVTGFPAAN